MPLILSIAAYVAVIPLLWGVSDRLPRAIVPIASVPYVAQLLLVISIGLGWTPRGYESIDWIPSLGVTIAVSTDSFALLLTAIVAGIGLLIVVYSGGYFGDTSRRSRFLGQMSLFTAGMAIVILGETMELFHLVSVALVIVGVVLMSRGKTPARRGGAA